MSIPKEAKSLYAMKRKVNILAILLGVLLIIGVCLSVTLGEANISVENVVRIIVGKTIRKPEFYDQLSQGIVAIVWDIRLPRILCGLFVGAALAIAGGVFQSLLLNPLADPYTLGISTGAAFFASVAIYFTGILGIVNLPILPMAFLGAILTLWLVTAIANRSRGLSSTNLIIAGIIVSSIMSAGISFLKNAAGDDVGAIVFWIMGSLAARSWVHVIIIAVATLIGGVVCFRYGNELNILCMGEENAKGLGVNVKRTRWLLLVAASLLTAACVSVSGIVGFVGLVIPHILRFSLTSNNKQLLPMAALLGGLVLMVADNISRTGFTNEIPVGVLTTLIGGPFFIYIFIRNESKGGV